jgi:hypothetical protein
MPTEPQGTPRGRRQGFASRFAANVRAKKLAPLLGEKLFAGAEGDYVEGASRSQHSFSELTLAARPMNDRQQAIDLLRRARDILAERLTDRILQNKDAILEDALGLGYGSEIDGVYEQLGMRLAHVNQLLSNLPAEEVAASDEPAAQEDVAVELGPDEFLDPPHSHVPAPHLALPGPGELLQLAGPTPAVSFQKFAARIFMGDVGGAGAILAELFELDVARATRCARVFYDGVRHNPEVIAKAAQLRRELQAGSYNTALVLLHDCFGLAGVESISVMQTLRARIERGV